MLTKELLEQELPLSEIADRRVVTPETIISHIEKLREKKQCPDVDYLKRELRRGEFDDIVEAFETVKTETLAPIYNYLAKHKKKSTYLKIRLVRLFL